MDGYCFLRYDNNDFFSDLDIAVISFPNESHITSNLEAYKDTVTRLLKSTLSEKAYEPANRGFAMGSANYTSTGEVYGLLQCWRTMESDDCKKCFLYARNQAHSCCSNRKGAQVLSTSCKIRYEIYPFFGSAESMLPLESNNPTTPSPPTSTTESHSSGKSSVTLPIILGLVGALILVFPICVIAMRKRMASTISGREITLVTHNEERRGYSPEARLIMQEKHFVFSLEELAESTQNFDENKKLGVGGFGVVYKGTSRDGKEIAVKKLSARSTQGKKELMNEVKLLANVQHRNLVKLLGCCVEGEEMLLVYEYFPKKSLDTFLFDPEKRRELSWQKRYNIIIGIAYGLLYLHEDSQLKIIHRDIKANNILLDEKLNAKIADFGLARLFVGDETHVNTKAAGT
ncbi:cysteine-rich receptor-like protein kinase 25 [Cryptomeria japonica]|uniref:cysteine-rich receptor-like protein kinase 25 n=1 Tax=Cryptomeria japonica TaxID=3369 RepID=UPI0027D9F780|nr:cysteine-rich receptor-like protein kinase 25 [Cryptomeria japonica]